MIKRIKSLYRIYVERSIQLQVLQDEVIMWRRRAMSPDYALKQLLNKDIRWIEYKNLSKEAQKEYYTAAKELRQNLIFQSYFGKTLNNGEEVLGAIAKEAMEFSLRETDNIKQVQVMRAAVAIADKFKRHVDNVTDPNAVPEVKDPYSAI